MYKLVIFDLDGVLIETKKIHFDALNLAISEVDEKFIISTSEHLSLYDGLKTTQKLELLTKNKGLSEEYHTIIWKRKQEITSELISTLETDTRLIVVFNELRKKGYIIGCCSNSIEKTVSTILSKLGLIEYFDIILSNEDVGNPKPHPEIYWNCMSKSKVLPEETLIIEDSPVGLMAASKSGAHVMRVKNPNDLTLEKIISKLNTKLSYSSPKWQGEKMNVLIPMAGAGTRFKKAGFTFPKPLIEIERKPMIQLVVENLNIEAKFIFIVQKQHRIDYNLDTFLNLIQKNCEIVEVDGVTEGAACTSLLAKKFIDNDEPLLMANSDQFIEWNSNEFMYKMIEQDVDGGIVTFKSTHPKWSFVKVNEQGFVEEVAEKKPISEDATVGIYYWKKGSDYVKYAEQMINENIRTNNEFYICPVYNNAIRDNKKIKSFEIEKMWGLGTPEDLDYFIKNYNRT